MRRFRIRSVRFTMMLLIAARLLAPAAVTAQQQFDHLGYRQGLINSSVSSILQDEAGFLWFGTQAGLQRYDGYGMKLFTSEPFNPNSLSHQLVQTIFLDTDGTLWVGTYGGLNRIDDTSGSITHFRHIPGDDRSLSNDVVISIGRDASGVLWVGTLDGLNRMDSESAGTFTRLPVDPDDPTALPNPTIRALFTDSRGRFWVGSYGGLSLVEQTADNRVRFHTVFAGPDGLPSPAVMSIAEDAYGYLWIGTWDGGISHMTPDGTFREHYRFPDNRVYQVLPSRSGLVYVATWGGGLMTLDPGIGSHTVHTHSPADLTSLAHNIVYSLYEDRSGIVWIGTNGNGISKLDPARRDYRFVHSDLSPEMQLGTGRVQLMYEDPNSRDLYIAIQNEGLNVRDPETGHISRLIHDPEDPASIGHNNVTAIIPDSGNTLLVGTNAGLYRLHPGTDIFESAWEPFAELHPSPPIVYALLRDQSGVLWVGTYEHGLLRHLPDGQVLAYRTDPADPTSLSNNLVYNLYQDSFGTIWVSTNGGLNRYLPETDSFRRYLYDPADPAGISSNSVGQIIEDSAGTMWIASRSGGLIRYHRDDDSFSHIGTTSGLSSNLVAGFLETGPGILHVATTNGMNRIEIDSLRVTLIDDRDGLTVREFAGGAITTAAGEHLFGAFSQIVRIPSSYGPSHGTPPAVQITSIRVMNTPYRPEFSAHTIGRIELPHTQNFLAFQFAAMDFSLPLRNRYRYRLVGLDLDWIDANYRRTADYTSLPAGDYTFEVIAADSRGTWSEEPARIAVRIRPPFWRTPGFLTFLFLGILFTAWLIMTLRTRTLMERTTRLEIQVAERTDELRKANVELQRVNATRDQFFSIIAHDLRGPLSGMAQLMGTVVSDFATFKRAELQEVSTVVSASARGLETMLENLLEWAHLHIGSVDLKPEPVRICDVVNSVFDAYRGTAHAKSVNMITNCPGEIYASVDPHGVRTIVANLVHNAVKFTRSGGAVTATASLTATDALTRTVLTIHDTGVGISADKLAEIFGDEKVYRTTGTAGEKGTGLGLTLCRDILARLNGTLHIDSIEGTGTTVVLELPWCDDPSALDHRTT